MNSFVNELLDKQQIRRRIHPASSGEQAGRTQKRAGISRQENARSPREGIFPGRTLIQKPAYRPAGIVSLFERNTGIIDKIKQNPGRPSRPRYTLSPRQDPLPRKPAPEREAPVPKTQTRERPYPKRNFPSFVIPAVPVTALFILMLGIFFIIRSEGGSFDWLGREVVNVERDQGSSYNLAMYAGVGSAPKSQNEGENIPLDLTETFAWQTYKVKRGDSVSKIAAAFSVSMDAIIASNGITNARALREGETLRIPNMDGIPYTVKNGDSLSGISRALGVPLEAILDANDIQSDAISQGIVLFIPGARMNREELKLALGELFIHPLRGARLTSPFGWRNDPISGVRRHHAAVDLSAPQGTPIKAAMDGKVSALGFNGTYGNYIIITHSGGFQTMYAHMYSFSVKKGDRVNQGVQVGTVGSTGYSTGPHLHFAVFKNNRPVNPLDFLGPKS